MAPFDIIDITSLGYRKVWQEKRFLARISALPFVVKLILMGASIVFGISRNFVWQALVMLPSFLAEGWVVVVLARMIFQEQNSFSSRQDGRFVMAGMVMYALIKFLQMGAMEFVYADPSQVPAEAQVPEIPEGTILFASIAFVLSLWGFRFLWVYIPLSAGFLFREVFSLLRGPMLSFYMIGVWLLCLVPFLLMMAFITGSVLESYREVAEIPLNSQLLLVTVQAVLDLAASIVATSAMAYAFCSMINRKREAH